MTIACIDVGYTESETDPTTALAACVVIKDWGDATSLSELVVNVDAVQDYQPGQFYLRELPCIKAVLSELLNPPTHIVIDGYVWLDDLDHPGLGNYLHDALNQAIPVIGVAKNPFKRSLHAHELQRGGSTRPLYITSAGIPVAQAASKIAAMHGPHRFPTILKRVDRLSRGEQPV
ncbi:MAG TPA: endonuclease V [Rhodopirellula baltica]|uniref:Probable endonuclease V (Deoxyinosine 3endonuclease) n=2 Tax=Rhodopirellula baltica TaxID=265606 RepID=Q7UEC7_RHOBA|nr:probable endonuclease V (deoxyinosine 3endonuclease) [Rhodopirellula baltica SH 1]HBE62205.1 endonuclease V [Rhodopirellula baltica]